MNELVEKVMYVTCNKNLIEPHMLETVLNKEVDVNNWPSKEAQMPIQQNHYWLGMQDSNINCSKKSVEAYLEFTKMGSMDICQVPKQTGIMGTGNKNGMKGSCSNHAVMRTTIIVRRE